MLELIKTRVALFYLKSLAGIEKEENIIELGYNDHADDKLRQPPSETQMKAMSISSESGGKGGSTPGSAIETESIHSLSVSIKEESKKDPNSVEAKGLSSGESVKGVGEIGANVQVHVQEEVQEFIRETNITPVHCNVPESAQKETVQVKKAPAAGSSPSPGQIYSFASRSKLVYTPKPGRNPIEKQVHEQVMEHLQLCKLSESEAWREAQKKLQSEECGITFRPNVFPGL